MTDPIWPEESKGFCDLHENMILWYGVPKIGKSTFGSEFPKALFLLTEDGAKHLHVKAWRIRNWMEFCAKVDTIEKNLGSCPFQNIIIDTVDNLSDMCVEFVCRKQGIEDLTDAGYGKGFAFFSREFKKQVNRLIKLGLGVCFISHAEQKSVKADSITNPYAATKADSEGMVEITVPTMDKRVRKYILGLVDMILYMTVAGQGQEIKRVIYTQPTFMFEAGDRTGRLPNMLPLDYQAFVSAYYGDSRQALVDRINKAEQHLVANAVDNFDEGSGTRMLGSRKKTLGTDDLNDPSIPVSKLQELLQKYTLKWKAHKKGTNKKETEDAIPADKEV